MKFWIQFQNFALNLRRPVNTCCSDGHLELLSLKIDQILNMETSIYGPFLNIVNFSIL